ncbi:MAG: hypothetical protein LBK03_02725 [Bacteroidales bacterium]|jgi:hypothetical protein|nr:hypothetical protein [Bacteroidales bacterium]
MSKNTILMIIATAIIIFTGCEKMDDKGTNNTLGNSNLPVLKNTSFKSIDFSKIKYEKGMLAFESFEDYAQTIDALLEVCEEYAADYLAELEKELGTSIDKADEDEVAALIIRDNFFPYNPVLSFINQIGFTESAYPVLRAQEIEWLENSFESALNPFDKVGVGYVQSALHNQSGQVMVGKGLGDWDVNFPYVIPNPSIILDPTPTLATTSSCRTSAEQYKDSPDFVYNKKTRKLKGLLRTHNNRTYCKTGCYYKSTVGWILWTNKVSLEFSGIKSFDCPYKNRTNAIEATTNDSGTGLTEKYYWTATPSYLFSTPNILGWHKCNHYNSTVIANI